MADLYDYCRTDIYRFYRHYGYVIAAAAIPVFLGIYSFFSSEIMNEEGHTFGSLMAGWAGVLQITIAHHITLFIMSNNIDATYLFWFPFSFMWVWVVAALADANPIEFYYQSLYVTVFKSPLFWMQILCFTFLNVIIPYAWLKYR